MRPELDSADPYVRDPGARPMTLDQWLAQYPEPVSARCVHIMRSVQWGDLQPTRFCWDLMLTHVLKTALLSESCREERQRHQKHGVRREVTRNGCAVYRVAAWERKPSKRSRKGGGR